ncbi:MULTISPECIES: CheR family methyltransferase [unclassified Leptolyngbya]|uniref:CheR family methyltransferase n=1 Tax=unclassified Leptolyngbya TaxID=2650499 RepID=UPI0016859ACA|nr:MULTISPECIES: CheR family methyltransferase [unclassified Leptolyngbya]MBD1909869.1 chemotaxis protein CheR [Leptolyngbya sp. FACHB-8]MBD2156965.1 chemotaxis protein CheR [Leptolyngbya sp. FACHB-16]
MAPPETNSEFEALLDYLKHNRGCDLTGYKHSTLMRRFQHRMQSLKIESYNNYLQYLQRHPEEYRDLLNDVLINVTGFFRDHDAWTYLADEVIPKIIGSKEPDEPIRIWSAGCAAGHEIYSLLILLAEALGIENCLKRVQCYATDADEEAIQQARRATYKELELASIPPEWLQKYFHPTPQGYTFHPALQHTVIFAYHDLTQDAPISKLDLLMCRNVLIYFKPEIQARVLVRFHFGLKHTGFLFLGKTETLVHRRPIFTSFHHQHRIYTKASKLEISDYLSIAQKSSPQKALTPPTQEHDFWRTLFETNPAAQLAIDLNGWLIGANEQASHLFDLTPEDWNRPFQELVPGKILRSHISIQAFYRARSTVSLKHVEGVTAKGIKYFDITIAPVFNAQRQFLGVAITFADRSDYQQLTEKLSSTEAELDKLREAMHTTQMELEAAHQEMHLLDQDPTY